MKADSLEGQRFGRLLVLSRAANQHGKSMWVCLCDCGQTSRPIMISNLKGGNTISCGCFRKERSREAVKLLQTHGDSKTVEYRAWYNMLRRCYAPKRDGFENYGGRGIKVCERWHNYLSFLADMGRRPSAKHSLDRIDVNGDYAPANCRWATTHEQAQNRREFSVGANELTKLRRKLAIYEETFGPIEV